MSQQWGLVLTAGMGRGVKPHQFPTQLGRGIKAVGEEEQNLAMAGLLAEPEVGLPALSPPHRSHRKPS